ncbi:MAG TPA: YcnI family protein [Microbacteriaceae bacterium]|jgi:uncharacterized protein YcnI|nr:YcnI family protein [Microbacteriaceae bacterium]
MKRPLFGATATLGLAAMLALAAPLAASAHVHVTPGQAAAGSSTTLTFTVPNESATAGTVKVEIDFPTATPFTSVTYQPLPGWTAAVVTETLPKPVVIGGTTVTEAPTKIVWTANAGMQITEGQFQQFVVSARPVPNTGSVELPAHQTYSDGTVVDWDEKTPASGVEPENPAPTLYINDAAPVTDTAGATVTPSSAPSAASAAANASLATALSLVSLAVGAIALVVGLFVALRRRSLGAAKEGK